MPARLAGRLQRTNDARLRRDDIEDGLLAGIKRRATAPQLMVELAHRVHRQLRDFEAERPDMAVRARELEQQIGNLADAIAGGGLHTSRTLGQRLQAA
jgi:hypothetical protein